MTVSTIDPRLVDAVHHALRRRDAGAAVLDVADDLVDASLAVARRMAAGGRLLAFGTGSAATDALHIAVEFVHPVIVGKRALPALALRPDGPGSLARRMAVLGRATDVAIALCEDGNEAEVLDALREARKAGLLTVALVGASGSTVVRDAAADHILVVGTSDLHIRKEVQVLLYHLLWELVQVFLDHPGLADGGADQRPATPAEALYPFLGGDAGAVEELLAPAAASARVKAAESVALLTRSLEALAGQLAAVAAAVATTSTSGGTVWTCGNGGSSSDAQELADDLASRTAGLTAVRAACLTADVGVITALANDVGFEVVFERQVRALGAPGDLLVGLSTSGNSANVLRGFAAAKHVGMTTVAFAGGDGGAMATSGDVDHLLVVPSSSVHRIQEVQTACYHVLREVVEVALTYAGPDGVADGGT